MASQLYYQDTHSGAGFTTHVGAGARCRKTASPFGQQSIPRLRHRLERCSAPTTAPVAYNENLGGPVPACWLRSQRALEVYQRQLTWGQRNLGIPSEDASAKPSPAPAPWSIPVTGRAVGLRSRTLTLPTQSRPVDVPRAPRSFHRAASPTGAIGTPRQVSQPHALGLGFLERPTPAGHSLDSGRGGGSAPACATTSGSARMAAALTHQVSLWMVGWPAETRCLL